MDFRTDLAMERRELLGEATEGTRVETAQHGKIRVTTVTVETEEGAKQIGKPIGKYITLELPEFTGSAQALDERYETIASSLLSLMPPGNGGVLFAGLGNEEITPDSLGPRIASRIFATRHLSRELQKEVGFSEPLREVTSIAPGVLGKTGVESAVLVKGVKDVVQPACVVAVDALCARSLSRLGNTIQLSDTGIAPGSGIGNRRARMDREYLGVPVIAIGVPTVVSAVTLAEEILAEHDEERLKKAMEREGADMIVAPKDADEMVKKAAELLSLGVNCAFQPSLSASELLSLL